MKKFKCNICGKEFSSGQKLGGHKTVHTRLPGKKNKCLFCQELTNNRQFCCKEHQHLYRMQEKNKRKVYLSKNIYLDINYENLSKYREKHPVCEICGKPERMIGYKSDSIAKLSIDHQHGTNHFRGLLCNNCNKRLGRFESHEKY